MCMVYKGIEYQYAFEFEFPVCYNPSGEVFRIVITDFMKDIEGFSGLCLENELFVVSENNKVEFNAFIDIIDEIVNITTFSITSYAKANDGQIPKPHRRVDDEEFIRKFNECKESGQSKYYQELLDKHYDQIRGYMFNSEQINNKTYEELEPDIRFCLTVFLVRLFIFSKLPQIKGLKIFKI